jgi:Eukaryotic aspartyl protease
MISDNMGISTGLVKSLEMGLAYQTSVGYGLMGIGYDTNEAGTARYPNLIDQLVTQGLINVKTYSLWLDDQGSNTGSILFGGIDQAKFQGQLKVINIQKDPKLGVYREFLVTMTALSITRQDSTVTSVSGTSLNIVLDSGTSVTYLPSAVVNNLIKALSAFDDTANTGLIYVDCNLLTTQSKSYMTFTFGSVEIRVPIQEMVYSIPKAPPKSPFASTCHFGILAGSPGGPYAFGDTFLRSAYVVYDLDHNQIGLAQTNFRATSSNIYEIPKGAAGIPLLTGAQSSGNPTPTNTVRSSVVAPSLASSDVVPKSFVTDTGTIEDKTTTSTNAGSPTAATGTQTTGVQSSGNPTPTNTVRSSVVAPSLASSDVVPKSFVTDTGTIEDKTTTSTNAGSPTAATGTQTTGVQTTAPVTHTQVATGGSPTSTSSRFNTSVPFSAAVSRTLQASNGDLLIGCLLSASFALLGGFGLVVLG